MSDLSSAESLNSVARCMASTHVRSTWPAGCPRPSSPAVANGNSASASRRRGAAGRSAPLDATLGFYQREPAPGGGPSPARLLVRGLRRSGSAETCASGAAGAEVLDQPLRDADQAGADGGKCVGPVEAGRLDLLGIGGQGAAGVVGLKAEHEGVRERPGLAAEVAQVGDAQPDLLEDLAVN